MNVQNITVLTLAILLSLVRCTAITEVAADRAPSVQAPRFVALLGTDQQCNVTIELGIVHRETRPLETQEDMSDQR